jgi:hypothetical protein
MKPARSAIGIVAWAFVAAVVLSLLAFAALLGPSRALRIAGAAAASTVIDGFAERPPPHRIPIIELEVPQAALDSLEADLPWSGGRALKAVLRRNGIAHKVWFRYRGVVTPSHFLGGKKSFRLNLKRSSPWAPYRRLNVINPKAHNLLNDHLAAWVAGTMGVPVPFNAMVFVRINGRDIGVMELVEQVDGDFERNRGLAQHQVPVLKGDYPPVKGRALPKGRSLWADAAHWEPTGDADSRQAVALLRRLVRALQKDSMPLEAHRDSIAALVDLETFLRYQAALLVINTVHIDQYHNQWLVLDPRTGRFYPVLWDALMLFAPPGEPLYYANDAVGWWVMRIPEWRLQRDRIAYSALMELHRNGGFAKRLDQETERILPSVLADRNKFGNVSLAPEDVHRVSLAHVAGSLAGLRRGASSYWDRLLQRMERTNVQLDHSDGLRLRSADEAPLRLQWTGPASGVSLDGEPVQPMADGDGWTLVLHRTLVPIAGGKDHPLADKQRFAVQPLDARLRFEGGTPRSLRITNAITDGPIH